MKSFISIIILATFIVANSLQAQGNMLVNGSVDGFDPGSNNLYWWYRDVNTGMGAAGSINSETTDVYQGSRSVKAIITAVASGTQPWCVQMVHDNGATGYYNLPRYKANGVDIQYYTLRFWAKADAARPVNMMVQDNTYSQAAITTRTLTTSWAQYDFDFDIPASFSATGYNFKPAFHLGYQAGTYFFDDFELGKVEDFAVLPVELISFKAQENKNNKTVDLNWEVAAESNLKDYTIERSADGRVFESIGAVNAKNKERSDKYSFEDRNPLKNLAYYRLKINEKDGTFKYSRIEVVRFNTKNEVLLAPNPASGILTVYAESLENLEITDMNGRVIRQFSNSPYNQFDISDLPNGIYQAIVKTKDSVSVQKLVKM
jgi:hypothetical protein